MEKTLTQRIAQKCLNVAYVAILGASIIGYANQISERGRQDRKIKENQKYQERMQGVPERAEKDPYVVEDYDEFPKNKSSTSQTQPTQEFRTSKISELEKTADGETRNIDSSLGEKNKNLYETIAKHEGFRDTAYNDTEGIRTIGIGFNLEKANARERIESLGLDYKKVFSNKQKLTREQAYRLMEEDVKTAISDVKNYLGNENYESLDNQAKEVITNMAFNLGLTRLSKFNELKKALIKKDYKEAAKEMKDSKWYSQTKNRAKELVSQMSQIN